MINHQQQRGVTMIGMLLVGIVIVFVALVTMKLVPAYVEFFEIKKVLKDIGGEPGLNSMSNAEIREHYEKRAMIDNITAVKPSDLEIDHSDGSTVVSAEYQFQTKLVGNVSLLVDFSASSGGL